MTPDEAAAFEHEAQQSVTLQELDDDAEARQFLQPADAGADQATDGDDDAAISEQMLQDERQRLPGHAVKEAMNIKPPHVNGFVHPKPDPVSGQGLFIASVSTYMCTYVSCVHA